MSLERTNYGSSSKFESLVGYSRAVRVGDFVYVTGTTAFDANGDIVGIGDAYAQTVQILQNIADVLERAGSRLEEVVRTRIFVVNIAEWEAVGRAHREIFDKILPATTMVEVSRLISPEMLVEIEADAVIQAIPVQD